MKKYLARDLVSVSHILRDLITLTVPTGGLKGVGTRPPIIFKIRALGDIYTDLSIKLPVIRDFIFIRLCSVELFDFKRWLNQIKVT